MFPREKIVLWSSLFMMTIGAVALSELIGEFIGIPSWMIAVCLMLVLFWVAWSARTLNQDYLHQFKERHPDDE